MTVYQASNAATMIMTDDRDEVEAFVDRELEKRVAGGDFDN